MKEPNVKETGGRRDWGFGVGELHPMVEAFFKSNPGVKAELEAPMNKGGGKRKSKKRKSKKRKSKRKKSKKSRKRSKTRRRR